MRLRQTLQSSKVERHNREADRHALENKGESAPQITKMTSGATNRPSIGRDQLTDSGRNYNNGAILPEENIGPETATLLPLGKFRPSQQYRPGEVVM